MSQELLIPQPWKPGVSQLAAFELVDEIGKFQTRNRHGDTVRAIDAVKASDLIILKMMEIW